MSATDRSDASSATQLMSTWLERGLAPRLDVTTRTLLETRIDKDVDDRTLHALLTLKLRAEEQRDLALSIEPLFRSVLKLAGTPVANKHVQVGRVSDENSKLLAGKSGSRTPEVVVTERLLPHTLKQHGLMYVTLHAYIPDSHAPYARVGLVFSELNNPTGPGASVLIIQLNGTYQGCDYTPGYDRGGYVRSLLGLTSLDEEVRTTYSETHDSRPVGDLLIERIGGNLTSVVNGLKDHFSQLATSAR